jgi:pyrimidine operon attenuation protein / uracil phosphoribosyltransferase
MTQEKTIMTEVDMNRTIKRMADEIVEKNKSLDNVVLIGILNRGFPLALRIASVIKKEEDINVPVGALDVSFYRDDIALRGKDIVVQKSDITFSVDNKTVILFDDVMNKGRTTRAALDALNDYGRPARVQLAVLVDRGGRDLPIQPDFCGKKVSAAADEDVAVKFKESDGEDIAVIK